MKTKNVALYFSDEMRYGLMSNTRRSWSKVGDRAVLPHQQAYENKYLFSAVSPIDGGGFHLMGIDEMDSEASLAFLSELKKQHPKEHVVVVRDNAPCHRRRDPHTIPGLTVIHLPSYSPELNPAERFFEEVRRTTANRIFENIGEQEILIENAYERVVGRHRCHAAIIGICVDTYAV